MLKISLSLTEQFVLAGEAGPDRRDNGQPYGVCGVYQRVILRSSRRL